MADADTIREVITPVLVGADEAQLEYLAELIADEDEGGPTRPLQEDLAPHVQGIEGFEDEDTANAAVGKIEVLLREKFAGGKENAPPAASPKPESSGPSLLSKAVNLGAVTETEKVGWGDVYGKSEAKGSYNDSWDAKEAQKKRKERKALKSLQLKSRAEPPPEAQMSQLTRMVLPTYNVSEPNNKDICVHNISLYTPVGSQLLDNADLKLTYQRRYGLIGKNGIGKTTLLKAIAAQEIDGFPKHLRCLHVSQECGSSEMRVVDAVIEADVELQTLLATEKDLLERMEKAEEGSKEAMDASCQHAEIQERLEEIEANTADSRARVLLAGLQFTEEMQNSPLSSMSGGWRVRAAIAASLFIRPEILMLDEPTNHLDLEAVLWLQEHLQTYPHTVLIVSHDRAFLNEVVTDILSVEDKKLTCYKGDFNSYEITRKEHRARQASERTAFELRRDEMLAYINRFQYQASHASLCQSRKKELAKLEEKAPLEIVDEVPFTFKIPSPDSAPGSALVQMDGCGFQYPPRGDAPPRTIFSNVDFNIDSGEKIGIVGPNGAGKSTMLKLLLSELDPSKGSCRKKPGVLVASFTQHHADKLDLSLSPVENLMQSFPGILEKEARSWIGGYGVQGEMQTNPCKKMSGGQKSRVAFAMLAFARPNLIVMDEPTNHLDMETIDALIEALRTFSGGVVAVTHDQHFVERVCNQLWVCGGGRVQRFKGEFKDYKKQVISEIKT